MRRAFEVCFFLFSFAACSFAAVRGSARAGAARSAAPLLGSRCDAARAGSRVTLVLALVRTGPPPAFAATFVRTLGGMSTRSLGGFLSMLSVCHSPKFLDI